MLFFHVYEVVYDLYLPLVYLVVFFETQGIQKGSVVSQRIHHVVLAWAKLLAMAIDSVAQY